MDWLLHPRRRAFADALVVTWVLVWAVAGWTAGRALDKVSEVTHSAEGAGVAVIHTGESIRDVDVPVVGKVFTKAEMGADLDIVRAKLGDKDDDMEYFQILPTSPP